MTAVVWVLMEMPCEPVAGQALDTAGDFSPESAAECDLPPQDR